MPLFGVFALLKPVVAMTTSRPQRLDQLLTICGICPRSHAPGWVRKGRVWVQGAPARDAGMKVLAEWVLVDGAPLECPDGMLILLHKPAGFVCSHDEGEGPRVHDLLPARWGQRKTPPTSIGRLDKDTTGLLLLTDQGELVHRLTSPRRHLPKIYELVCAQPIPPRAVELFAAGTLLLAGESKPCLPAELTIDVAAPCHARLVLSEGRFHQVKRMLAAVGCEVVKLHRSGVGDLTLGDLPEGAWVHLPLDRFGAL
jgi:16S rRNA pseudouridine516 synthase